MIKLSCGVRKMKLLYVVGGGGGWGGGFFFQAEDGIRDHCVTGSSDVCSSDPTISESEPKHVTNSSPTQTQFGASSLHAMLQVR